MSFCFLFLFFILKKYNPVPDINVYLFLDEKCSLKLLTAEINDACIAQRYCTHDTLVQEAGLKFAD